MICKYRLNITINIICSAFFLINLFVSLSYSDIAFVANVDENWELFKADDNMQNISRLTNTPFDEKNPSWSSDRTKIVYATNDGKLNIYDIITKKSYKTAINQYNPPKVTSTFYPNQNRIIFAQFRPFIMVNKDNTDIMSFDINNQTTKTIIAHSSMQMWPDFSPDGSQLIYTNINCSTGCSKIIQELWIADSNGRNARQLLLTNSFCQQPSWSPDGKKIAFSSDKSGNFDIWILSLEYWKLAQVTTDKNLDVSPSWSPDSEKLAFISTRSGLMEIWVKDIENNKLKKLILFGNKITECKDVVWK